MAGPEGEWGAALFAFIQRLGGSRWFSTYDEMTGNYAGATFSGGTSHLSAWDGGEPCAALGVMSANPRALGLYLSEGFARERVSAVWRSKLLAD